MGLSANAITVLERRYLWKDGRGGRLESPEAMMERVASAIAAPEGKSAGRWADKFVELMSALRFLPNSPTLMNAGREGGQLSACFVLPVEDSLEGIFETLKQAAKIHQSGGGTGFAFSRVRPRGSTVRSTSGVASGPVSFMRIYDVATETIKQGGARRGANMAVLRVDHPDIVDFIDSKRDQRSVTNFNISVGATAEFMTALARDGEYALRDPASGREMRSVSAGEIFNRITQAAWECGDPGMVFLDRINLVNPTPNEGEMESTNPCGEQPLLPYESCNLGSLNLSAYHGRRGFDWELFVRDVGTAVRFLDNVIDVNCYPVVQCWKITHRNRKIGLGVMGFADLLLLMGLPYASPAARDLGERIMSVLDREAKRASMSLARERGAFANYKYSIWKELGYPPLRNATVSTVAPTGTISIIAGVSSGIEPIFSGVFFRNVLAGERLREVHPAVAQIIQARGADASTLTEEEIARILGPVWSPARGVEVEAHVRMQAAFQRFSDSAVSKTINLSENASVADVRKAYLLAYELGCKGITIYRDRSRPSQVLEGSAQPVEGSDPLDEGMSCPSC